MHVRERAVSVDVDVPPVVSKAAGDLVALAGRIQVCEGCDRAGPARAYGTGYPRAPVMLVAERPSAAALETTNAFADEAQALDKAFEALGVPLSWLYGATAVRCGSAPATGDQIAACSTHLLVEIEAVEPRVVVLFGAKAVDAIRALDGRCGLRAPSDMAQGALLPLRPGLDALVTEPMPEGVTQKDAKRRLWRDLQQIPPLILR